MYSKESFIHLDETMYAPIFNAIRVFIRRLKESITRTSKCYLKSSTTLQPIVLNIYICTVSLNNLKLHFRNIVVWKSDFYCVFPCLYTVSFLVFAYNMLFYFFYFFYYILSFFLLFFLRFLIILFFFLKGFSITSCSGFYNWRLCFTMIFFIILSCLSFINLIGLFFFIFSDRWGSA